MNQQCKVCGEPAAGFHFGAFTCEGCKSFFGRTYNNLGSISECKNNGECVINKKNRTACKACRLRKCLLVGMSKSGSRYGRRSNWFKIHCLLQEQQQAAQAQAQSSNSQNHSLPSGLDMQKSIPPPHPDLAGFYAQAFASSLNQSGSPFINHLYGLPRGLTIQHLQAEAASALPKSSAASDSGTSSAEDEVEQSSNRLKITDHNFFTKHRFHPFNGMEKKVSPTTVPLPPQHPISPASDPGCFFGDKKVGDKQFSPPPNRVSVSSLSWPNASPLHGSRNGIGNIDPNAWKDLWLRSIPLGVKQEDEVVDSQEQPIDLSIKPMDHCEVRETICSVEVEVELEERKETEDIVKTAPLDLTLDNTKRNEIVGT